MVALVLYILSLSKQYIIDSLFKKISKLYSNNNCNFNENLVKFNNSDLVMASKKKLQKSVDDSKQTTLDTFYFKKRATSESNDSVKKLKKNDQYESNEKSENTNDANTLSVNKSEHEENSNESKVSSFEELEEFLKKDLAILTQSDTDSVLALSTDDEPVKTSSKIDDSTVKKMQTRSTTMKSKV